VYVWYGRGGGGRGVEKEGKEEACRKKDGEKIDDELN
jgi:hypothetical protein